jgi:hypothetical protein
MKDFKPAQMKLVSATTMNASSLPSGASGVALITPIHCVEDPSDLANESTLDAYNIIFRPIY